VRPHAKIGDTLLSTVKLSVSGATSQNTTNHRIEIYYDVTRVNANEITVSPSPLYTVSTAEPGKLVLTLVQNVTSGSDFETTIAWKLIPGPTEEGLTFPLYAQFCTPLPANTAVLTSNTVELSGFYNRPRLTKYANGDPYDDGIVDFGRTNEDGSYRGTVPKEVLYTFRVDRVERLIGSYILTDTLPTYTTIINGVDGTATAVFNPSRNPGWVDNGDGTVSHIRVSTATMSPIIPSLVLEFPDAKSVQTFTNRSDMELEPYRKAPTESTMTCTSSVRSMLVPDYTPEGTFIKRTNVPFGRRSVEKFYDVPEDKSKEFAWSLYVGGFRPSEEDPEVIIYLPNGEFLSNIKLRDDGLDPRMRYTAVDVYDFKGSRVTAYKADGTILYDVYNQQGRVTFPIAIRDDIAYIEFADSPLKIYSGEIRAAIVYSELRNPASVIFTDLMNGPDPMAIDGTGIRFFNYGHMTHCFLNNAAGEKIGWGDMLITWADETWLQPFECGVGISKNIVGGRTEHFAGEAVSWNLALDFYDGNFRVARQDVPSLMVNITDVVIRDVLPLDFVFETFVPSNSLRSNTTGLSWRAINQTIGGVEYTVIEITAATMRPAMIARTTSLGEIKGSVSLLATSSKALLNNVYMEFTEYNYTKRGDRAKNNNTGFNPNPFPGNDEVLWDDAHTTVLATQDMAGQKEIRKRIDSSTWGPWTYGVLTDPGADFQYRLRVRNNMSTARNSLVLVDVFPFVGDVTIDATSMPHDPRTMADDPRTTAFSNTLASTNAFSFYDSNGTPLNPALFQVEYLLNPLPADYATYNTAQVNAYLNTGAAWTSSVSSSDLDKVTAVRISSLGGFSLGAGEEFNVVIDMKAPLSFELAGQRAINTFVRKDNVITQFLEMPPVYNELLDKKAEIRITKHGEGGAPLAGAVFGLYLSNGTLVATATSNSAGLITFVDIERDDYYIQEITPPPLYQLNTTKYQIKKSEFVDPDPTSYSVPYLHTGYHSAVGGTPILNTPEPVYGDLRIVKYDGNNNAFADIQFEVRRKTAPFESYLVSTDSNGVIQINHLLADTYIVKEIATPGRLEVIPEFEVTVTGTASTLVTSSLSGYAVGRVTQNGAIQIDIKNDVASAVFYKLGLFDDTMAAKPPTELLPSDGELLGGVEFKLYPVTSTSTKPYTLGALIDTKTTSSSNVGKGTVTFGNLKVGH
jgi:hypothetical protein